jgi:methionine synthase / methylenetetrahydrofolate reductase(NADPH)
MAEKSDKLSEKMANSIVVFDGAMGTELYKRNFFVNICYEGLCSQAPDVILTIHKEYRDAGADVLTTNTYAANFNQLSRHGLGEQVRPINHRAVELARKAGANRALIAGSVGPVGEPDHLLQTSEERLVDILAEQIEALEEASADFIIFETLPSRADLERAYRAINVKSSLPYVLSMKVDAEGESPRGEPFPVLLQPLDQPGRKPVALGLNCGDGAASLLSAFEKLRTLSAYPVIIQPNAGLPKLIEGRTIYLTSAEYLATYAKRYLDLGARGVGGCCGVGPEHIRELARNVRPAAVSMLARPEPPPRHEGGSLAPLQLPAPLSEKSSLGAKLARGQWVGSVEIVPPRGYQLNSTLEKAMQCKAAGVDAINIPDGPRASSRISPMVTARQILAKVGIEPILHFSCRDRNLIGMQADLLGCAAEGIQNILFVTGDPPKTGREYAYTSAVFDLDSIGIVKVQTRLNRGVDIGGQSLEKPTRAVIGVGADPNAIDLKRELRRTREKIDAGAEFIITQPVFSVGPLLAFLDAISAFAVPVLAGIWPLTSYRNAEFMRNEVPGVVVPDEIMSKMAAAQSKEDQRVQGLAIACDCVRELRDKVQGIQVSAPFGNVATALAVIAASR